MVKLKLKKPKLSRYLLLGVGCYLLFLVVELPASLITKSLFKPAPNGLQLQSVRGTLWRGEALDARIGRVLLGRLKWEVSPFGMLLGNMNVDFNFNQQDTQGKGNLKLGFGGGVYLQDADLRIPADGLGSLFGGLPMNFTGNLLGKINELDIRKGEVFKGKGRIVWQKATMTAPYDVDLGDILIELKPDNNNTRIAIADQNEMGQLKINLEYIISGNGKYRWEGTVAPRGNAPEKLVELLKFFGRADSNGIYYISRSGQLTGW